MTEVENIVAIDVSKVRVNEGRYRIDMGDIDSLASSISQVGQLVPIIVTEDLTLIAGERRLRAHRKLEKPTIKAIIKTKDEVNDKVVEILENLERKDFTWQEQVSALDDLHQILKSQGGKAWSGRKTAEKVGLSVGGVCTDLNLAEILKSDPEMFDKCKTKEAALKTLQKFKIDEAMAELTLRKSKTNYGKKAKNYIFKGDCTDLITHLPEGSINALISDPFYGLNISDVKFRDVSRPLDIYEDGEDSYFITMRDLITKASKVLAKDSWVLMFCRAENTQWLIDTWTKAGFSMDTIPGVWHRTGQSGQTNQPGKYFARSYEPFVYGCRGETSIIRQGLSNVLAYPGITPTSKDHPVQKPLPLMEDIVGRFCLPGYTILDPMCGSGTTIVAAIKRGCNAIGFDLDDRYYNMALNNVSEALKIKDGGLIDSLRG